MVLLSVPISNREAIQRMFAKVGICTTAVLVHLAKQPAEEFQRKLVANLEDGDKDEAAGIIEDLLAVHILTIMNANQRSRTSMTSSIELQTRRRV